MDLQRFALKVYLEDPSKLDPKALIPVFHRWIQQRAIPDQLLIDVADYSHVPHGPGVMLMAHEGHFSLDSSDQRLGLMYTRKQPTEGSFGERFQAVLRATLQAHQLLAQEADLSGGLVFKNDEFVLVANDRLQAPNTTESFETLRDELGRFLPGLLGGKPTIAHVKSPPRERLALSITVPQALDIPALLQRLSVAS